MVYDDALKLVRACPFPDVSEEIEYWMTLDREDAEQYDELDALQDIAELGLEGRPRAFVRHVHLLEIQLGFYEQVTPEYLRDKVQVSHGRKCDLKLDGKFYLWRGRNYR